MGFPFVVRMYFVVHKEPRWTSGDSGSIVHPGSVAEIGRNRHQPTTPSSGVHSCPALEKNNNQSHEMLPRNLTR